MGYATDEQWEALYVERKDDEDLGGQAFRLLSERDRFKERLQQYMDGGSELMETCKILIWEKDEARSAAKRYFENWLCVEEALRRHDTSCDQAVKDCQEARELGYDKYPWLRGHE